MKNQSKNITALRLGGVVCSKPQKRWRAGSIDQQSRHFEWAAYYIQRLAMRRADI